jgi:hypothetical protein
MCQKFGRPAMKLYLRVKKLTETPTLDMAFVSQQKNLRLFILATTRMIGDSLNSLCLVQSRHPKERCGALKA